MCAAAFCQARGSGAEQSSKVEFFESRIRPVLVERCYRCHNSTRQPEGGLALDHRAGLLKGGDGGAIVHPGRPSDSRLLNILRHEVDGLNMPKDEPKLEAQTLADFKVWIADGAVDPRDRPPTAGELAHATAWPTLLAARKKWWSFQPIVHRPAPTESASRWSSHPVDAFIFAGLKTHGLEPALRASSYALIRRLHFAIVGLPPSQAEISKLADRIRHSPDEYGRLVDRLLADPRFGERWARHWMDWIRYAESHGSEGDPEIVGAWRYRDYLIRALNADVPIDQLLREHVAGDLMDNPRRNESLGINESAIGTAHWRMVFHGFGPTDPLEEKVRFVDDQINAFSKAFLGLTVSCARCHDHKFDAIGQSDYYSLFGILAACRPGRIAIDLPARQRLHFDEMVRLKPAVRSALAGAWLADAKGARSRLMGSIQVAKPKEKQRYALDELQQATAPPTAARPFEVAWKKLWARMDNDRKRRLAFQQAQRVRRFKFSSAAELNQWTRTGLGLQAQTGAAGEFAIAPAGDRALTGIYPAGAYSHAVSTKHAARLTSRDVHLAADYSLWLLAIGDGGAAARYVVRDYPRDGTIYPTAKLTPQWQWHKFDLSYWTSDDVHIELSTPSDAPLMATEQSNGWFGVREVVIANKAGSGPPNESLEALDPIAEIAEKVQPRSAADLVECCLQAIQAATGQWRSGSATDAQALLLAECLQMGVLENNLERLPTVRPLVEKYRAMELAIASPIRVPGLEETVGRTQFVYQRGNHKRPAAAAPPRFLEAIDPTPYPAHPAARLRLADDLIRDDNPLTRRVIVNRIWHHLFGRGLVATPDNFGRLGAMPTHPELLDHLANALKTNGWSLKKAIRFLLLSQTWQQSSTASASAVSRDPDNRLWSHAMLRRLDAEAIRDSLLATTGEMDARMFGPSVGGESKRRSVYVRVQRNSLDPFLRAFDFPEPFSSTGSRDETNVPAQSLALLNDPQIDRLASAWAKTLLTTASASGDGDRIQRMFLAVFSRAAEPAEIKASREYLANAGAARESAWRELAKSLFLAKEFIYLP